MINWEKLARRIYGNRKDDTDTGSPAGAVPAPTPGERPGGTEPAARARPRPEPVAEEIVAWRGWVLVKGGDGRPCLRSLSHKTYWDGPRLVADQIPSEENTNGIYALTKTNHYHETCRAESYVWGTVALSGIVVEGETGYRAQQAVIRSLTVRRHPEMLRDTIMLEIVCALEDRYQCPVELDADAIWHSTPKEEHLPGKIFYASVGTQMSISANWFGNTAQSAMSQNQQRYYQNAMLGIGGLLGSGGR